MTVADDFARAPSSACPACVVVPAAERIAALRAERDSRIVLSLPQAAGAGAISGIEGLLQSVHGVRSARVNLTLKRAIVEAAPDITPARLVAHLGANGHEAHELDPGLLSATETDRRARDLLMRTGVAFFAMMNIMLLSVAVWSGAEAATRDLFHWISAAIALPTVIFCGQPFFQSAWASLRQGRLGMDVPISLALILATSISLYETWMQGDQAYFATLTTAPARSPAPLPRNWPRWRFRVPSSSPMRATSSAPSPPSARAIPSLCGPVPGCRWTAW
jgi:P-type Cu2+ transporter